MNVFSVTPPVMSPAAASRPVRPAHPVPERATRTERRAAIGARFLDALEGIVQRHRSLAPGEHGDLHAELIAAEVAHQLALVRSELARAPQLRGSG